MSEKEKQKNHDAEKKQTSSTPRVSTTKKVFETAGRTQPPKKPIEQQHDDANAFHPSTQGVEWIPTLSNDIPTLTESTDHQSSVEIPVPAEDASKEPIDAVVVEESVSSTIRSDIMIPEAIETTSPAQVFDMQREVVDLANEKLLSMSASDFLLQKKIFKEKKRQEEREKQIQLEKQLQHEGATFYKEMSAMDEKDVKKNFHLRYDLAVELDIIVAEQGNEKDRRGFLKWFFNRAVQLGIQEYRKSEEIRKRVKKN